ncbi:MAG TPA: SdrD B-like domain-containing protein [Meiothermus sp.]|nr:SdrD B-like domain-containing protein [Meiothermus sp.]
MKRGLFLLAILLGSLAMAQFPISESFMNSAAPGWVIGGNAYLTSGNGDSAGQGWLRLTTNIQNQKGYAYYNVAFPSTLGVRLDFDFLAWGGTGGTLGADGLSVFLFDGATTNFQIGDFGGGLGYCQGYSSSPVGGLSNAYVGIAFDEWGNFSNPNDRCPNGGPVQRPDSVAIRGPGNGNTGYAYLTGTANRLGGNTSIDYETFTSARPSPSAYYRKARVELLPVAGVYQITVYLATSQSGALTQVLGPYTMPSPPPATLKIGFAGSTGGSTNYHEVRNLSITTLTAPADLKVTKTGPATAAPGGSISYSVTVSNVGINPLVGASFSDNVPAAITGVSWSCTGSGGASCASASGSGNAISTTLNLPLSSSVTFTINGTVSPSAAGQTLTNTASAYPPTGYGDTNPADNTASASTQVGGFSVSGRVYQDLQPNGVREPSEDWSGAPTVYVKLIQGSSAVAVQTVSPGTGTYSFTNILPGSYTLILDDNPSTSDTTPTPPAGWLFVNPAGSRSLSVSTSSIGGQDFGLFNGSRVSGRVFYDDGEAGGTANNAVQDGGERGVSGVTVTATQGSNARTALTDTSGDYTLWLPASLFSTGNVTLSHPQSPATGSNVGGSSVSSASSLADPAARQRTLAYAVGQNYAGYNFGLVRESRLYPPGSGQAPSPGTITYSHLYRPGTLGTVTLSQSGGGFTYQARLDANCNGQFDPGEDFQSLPLSFTVGSSWSREADGSLRACAIELRVIIPAGKPTGSVDITQLGSSLVWANNPSVTDSRTLTDTTTVQAPGGLNLSKQVRNCGLLSDPNGACSSSFATSTSGRPEEVLEYCITYRNQGTQAVTQVVISDPIPFFSSYVTGSLRLNGTILSDGFDADAGEVSSGLVVIRVGNVSAGGRGEVCYRVQIR